MNVLPAPSTTLLTPPNVPPVMLMLLKLLVPTLSRLSEPLLMLRAEAVNAPVSVVAPAVTFSFPVPVTPALCTSTLPPAKLKVLARVALPAAP